MYSISSICLLALIVISLFSYAFELQQEQYAAAIGLSQNMDITLVHSNTMDNSAMAENSSIVLQKQEATAAVKSFQEAFCGTNSSTMTPNSTRYITETTLPQNCEMPLGIGVDNNAHRVWYVSTKKGVLGSFDIKQNKFDQEHIIPNWGSRQDPVGYSQVWSLKVDDSSSRTQHPRGEIWFTDVNQNAIWKFIKSSQSFEIYKIPSNSSSFGTTYPISLEIDHKNNRIFFVGTFSASLWIGDMTKMKNGTSDGISHIPIPINRFNGIDPVLITTGSIALDSEKGSVWISMLSYGRKGEIFRYDIDTQSFETFDLPAELSSPLGMAVDDSGHLWITNAGTSIFYKLNPDSGNIIKFVTSKVSPRVFGRSNGGQVPVNYSNISKNAYTLPYWIQKASDGSLWFNEQEGNKIARFDPSKMILTEYWIPSQNRIWGNCPPSKNTNTNSNQSCGIANVLQFSIRNNKQAWFSEWSENKIGKLDRKDHMPFSVTTFPQKELTLKRGESREIKVKVTGLSSSSFSNSSIHMIASGTLTPTGDLGNSTGSFSQEGFSINADGKSKQLSFTFKPSLDLKPGQYVLMIGAENEAVAFLRAIKVNLN
jgi:virginiamycin B lyase